MCIKEPYACCHARHRCQQSHLCRINLMACAWCLPLPQASCGGQLVHLSINQIDGSRLDSHQTSHTAAASYTMLFTALQQARVSTGNPLSRFPLSNGHTDTQTHRHTTLSDCASLQPASACAPQVLENRHSRKLLLTSAIAGALCSLCILQKETMCFRTASFCSKRESEEECVPGKNCSIEQPDGSTPSTTILTYVPWPLCVTKFCCLSPLHEPPAHSCTQGARYITGSSSSSRRQPFKSSSSRGQTLLMPKQPTSHSVSCVDLSRQQWHQTWASTRPVDEDSLDTPYASNGQGQSCHLLLVTSSQLHMSCVLFAVVCAMQGGDGVHSMPQSSQACRWVPWHSA
jgi:hypothetical protein